jgi:hypothetical protein
MKKGDKERDTHSTTTIITLTNKQAQAWRFLP